MPKQKKKPKRGALTVSTSVTIDVSIIEAARERAAAKGFRHSFSGYMVSLLEEDLKRAKLEHNPGPNSAKDEASRKAKGLIHQALGRATGVKESG